MSRAAIVLCGGASRRMGSDKAWLPYQGSTLLEHIVARLRPCVERVLVAAAPGQSLPGLPEEVEIVRDEVVDEGPLRGILTALDRLADDDLAVVWSVDEPGAVAEWAVGLLARSQKAEAVVPMADDVRRPLTAVYRVGPARAAARRLLAEKSTAAWRLAEALETRYVPIEELSPGGREAQSVHNVNTPDDYRRLLERSSQSTVDLLRRQLETHDRERKLTAYEIHDGLVQDVTGALLRVESLIAKAPDAVTESGLRDVAEVLRGAIEEGRRLIAGLRPPVIEDLGLSAAIEYLISTEFRQRGLDVDLVRQGEIPRCGELWETSVYRIAQESLTNVLRHSGASHAEIELRRDGDQLSITIRDVGRGFDPAQRSPLRLGLNSIQDRARVLGGKAEIASRPGHGTEVRVRLPLDPLGEAGPAQS